MKTKKWIKFYLLLGAIFMVMPTSFVSAQDMEGMDMKTEKNPKQKQSATYTCVLRTKDVRLSLR